MSILLIIAEVAGCISAIAACIALFVKPIRERIFNNKRATEGEKCLLRSEMLRIFYKYKDKESIHQYELENFIKLYEAYIALGGNSFIMEVHEEVMKWDIVR